jgi:hypothetical protein
MRLPRAYLLRQLTDGERAHVERLEAEVLATVAAKPQSRSVTHPLGPHISEQALSVLTQLVDGGGWRAYVDRRDGLVLVMSR